MQIDLRNRVVAITGASEGIGAEIAKSVGRCGGRIGIISRDHDQMRAVAEAVRQHGGEALIAPADVTDSDQMKKSLETISNHFGGLDGVVANAGTNGTWSPIDQMLPEQWRQTSDINLTGTFLTVHHAVPHLRGRGGGSIVIISSINGTRTFTSEGATAYASSKAGQLALTKMLALELAKAKIRVNAVCPGAIESKIHEKTNREHLDEIQIAGAADGVTPLTGGAMGKPSDVANLVAFLLSDLASHITGTPVWVDGGQSLVQ